MYKLRDILATNVMFLIPGAPAVEVADGIVNGFVVISLAILVGKAVGAKIVLAVRRVIGNCVRSVSLGTSKC